MTGHRSSSLQTVGRAIAVPRSFSQQKRERKVGEKGLHRRIVSRLTSTWERGGLRSRRPASMRHRLGIELRGVAADVHLRQAARPVLRHLAESRQESVNLSVLDITPRVANLEQPVPATHRIKNTGRVRRRIPLLCTASGKVLPVSISPRQLDVRYPVDLRRLTRYTTIDPHWRRESLRRTDKQGFAVAREELEEGLSAVANPVCDYTGSAVRALTVAGPSFRVTRQSLPHLIRLPGGVAAQVSERPG